jgi:hypothetical protein
MARSIQQTRLKDDQRWGSVSSCDIVVGEKRAKTDKDRSIFPQSIALRHDLTRMAPSICYINSRSQAFPNLIRGDLHTLLS